MPETFAPAHETFAPPSTLLAKLQKPAPAGPGGRHHVAGLVEMNELKPGLIVQRMRVRDLEDRETHGTVLPGLKIGLVVGGQSDFWLGRQAFRLGPERAGPLGGMLVAVAEPDSYRRHAHRGQDEHKLVLTLLPEWLQELGGDDARTQARIRAFCASHLARLNWQPSARAISLAHQVVHAPARLGLIDRLHQEARVIEIVAEALGAIVGDGAPEPCLSTRGHRRLRELLGRLDAGEFDGSSLADIASSIGMSASSLQRSFKAFSGESLFEYLRGRRLDAARLALEREGLTVGQAAMLAGYGNAANFATAFRRRFGCPPSALRARC